MTSKRWTLEDDALIRRAGRKASPAALSEQFGGAWSPEQVKRRQAHIFGRVGPRPYAWEPADDRLVIALFPTASREEVLAALPRRSWEAIRVRASYLGLRRTASRPTSPNAWTPEEDAVIWPLRHLPEAALVAAASPHLPGRGRAAISTRASRLRMGLAQSPVPAIPVPRMSATPSPDRRWRRTPEHWLRHPRRCGTL